MTLTTFPQISSASPTSPDLKILNLSRLLTRLEHNLLSPSADLKSLRRNEYQRMRIAANVEYARTLLSQLERTLPTLKPLDRRHELQTDLTRKRQTLKLLQDVLDRSSAEAEIRRSAETDLDSDEEDEIILDGEEEEAVTVTPEAGSTSSASEGNRDAVSEEAREEVHAEAEGEAEYETDISQTTPQTTASTTTAPPPSATAAATPTLRHRHQRGPAAATDSTAIATGSATSTSKLQETEQTLDAHRAEQEDLTSSLLSLASQLKTSSQAFHSSLEAEKSVLARAVEGLDRTTTNMGAAEKRMGMLRRMTEGKGWWGRIMLYAWIFGLWIVAVLIVFLGPKLRL
ncbi:hypothetical protein CNMCM8980_006057 [Aspergillus fumigatiaffinis]|jgi:hypothetical protein|uniref:Synaptobrevin n=1 Tax=Aspergillus fumigatiaffinis TaxID=340414 RepID=A0A8H4M466_9EURO|nr:hypothetical protein CNMCM5878_006169 [Aspergillus fumigatiaffinis]KAF4228759.1 hypothetical protein CNMCM6457_006745 [Aspergillus fumigatiaffinis]KAF4238941.1 hypothetical protein CNMCM6805_006108 [Aspergillus fumigatiaffinis]KAF4248322.1 hypothetical protein CNMCM8980_006057 [Aspergillus fumigatiaffinis]